VVERGERPDLESEARQVAWIAGMEQLDRHCVAGVAIERAVDRGHPSRAHGIAQDKSSSQVLRNFCVH
jgi:hypothetical protein